MKNLGRLLSIADAARAVGVRISQFRKAIRRGEMSVMRHRSGRVMGVYEAHVEAWQAERLGDVRQRPPIHGVDVVMQALIREMGA